jgi:hypothetical protein
MNRIQCNCGAVYEAVNPKDRTQGQDLFKCLVCGKEIMSAKAYTGTAFSSGFFITNRFGCAISTGAAGSRVTIKLL